MRRSHRTFGDAGHLRDEDCLKGARGAIRTLKAGRMMMSRLRTAAKGISLFVLAFRSVATLTAGKAVPAMKLAVAEKHTGRFLILVDASAHSYRHVAPFHACACPLILTRFNISAFATTTSVEPDIESAAISGLRSSPMEG